MTRRRVAATASRRSRAPLSIRGSDWRSRAPAPVRHWCRAPQPGARTRTTPPRSRCTPRRPPECVERRRRWAPRRRSRHVSDGRPRAAPSHAGDIRVRTRVAGHSRVARRRTGVASETPPGSVARALRPATSGSVGASPRSRARPRGRRGQSTAAAGLGAGRPDATHGETPPSRHSQTPSPYGRRRAGAKSRLQTMTFRRK